MANVKLPEITHHGAVAWCKRCSRTHHRGHCDLVEVERKSKVRKNPDGSVRRGGNKVVHLIHPKRNEKS